jgi:thioesterase-3
MRTVFERRIMNYQLDSFGVVHHARYLELLEEGRWLYCYGNGLVEQFLARGLGHAVVNITVDYRAGAGFGDTVRIETEVARVGERSVVFGQTVLRDCAVLAEARITNVFFRVPGKDVVPVGELEEFWTDLPAFRT